MATVLAIAIAVMLDKWASYLPGGATLASNRSTSWMDKYFAKLLPLIDNFRLKQSYVIAALLVIPLIVVVLLAKLLFWKLLGIVGSTLFVAFTLFYYLGNNNAGKKDSEFVAAHERSFGILFWFSILGIIGALLYWFLIVSKKAGIIAESDNSQVRGALTKVHAVAAWLPARITGFIYALVGNFTSGFSCWLNCMRNPKMPSGKVLNDCGQAATDSSIESDATNLVDRSFIAWVVLSILIAIYI